MNKQRLGLLLLIGIALTILWPPANPYGLLPYHFAPNTHLTSPAQQRQTSEATLLIVGDRHGQHFTRYLPQLRAKINPLFGNMNIVNLAAPQQGIHRTIKQLQELPKLPTLVLLIGGYDEFYEQKFHLSHYSAIQSNFHLLKDNKKRILLTFFPFLAPLLSQPFSRLSLTKAITPAPHPLNAIDQQKALELRFKLYEMEVQQLIEQVKQASSKLILTTAPLPLQKPPQAVCTNASTPQVEQKLAQIKATLKSGDAKNALSELKKWQNVIVGHAGFFHLLGQAYYQQGVFTAARQPFALANSFDCAPRGSSHILNNIIRRKAKENTVSLVDFDQLSSTALGREQTFKAQFPTKILYQRWLEPLASTINRHLETLHWQATHPPQ